MSNIVKDFVIETPLAEVFIGGVSQGLHNEYTCRNLQLQVKKGVIKDLVQFLHNGVLANVETNGQCVFNDKKFGDGFFDVSYTLAFELLD